MNKDDYAMCQDLAVGIARQLLILPLGDFIEAINKAQTVGPIVDPTLYRAGGETLQRIKEIAEALNRAKNEIVRINKAIGERAPKEPPIEKVAEALSEAETKLIARDPEVQAGLQEMAQTIVEDTVVEKIETKAKDKET